MPNETIASPIEITPVASFVGNENQSGHQAVFSGASYDEIKGKIIEDVGLRPVWTHSMTDEEAMLELQHGKIGSPEYHKAQQRLVAKVVSRYGKTDSNFLRNGEQDLDRNWTHASGLLRVDVSKDLQDKPSKHRMLETLSDSARLYNRAYELTRQYVRNDLVEPNKLKEYNNLDPQLRREMLRLFQPPQGVKEKWMYTSQKTEDSKPAKPPEVPKPTPPQPPEDPKPTELEKIGFKYLKVLTAEQRTYLTDNFNNEDLMLAAQRLNKLAPGSMQFLQRTRTQDKSRFYIFIPDENATGIGQRNYVEENDTDNFFNNSRRLEYVFGFIEKEMMQNSNLTFGQLMAMNMMAYTNETPEFIKADFNFKKQLFERYKAKIK